MGVSKYPDDMVQVVAELCKGRCSTETLKLVNEHYGYEVITLSHLKAFMKNHYIYSGYNSRFKKGKIPWSATHYIEPRGNMLKTRFKKGDKPHNQVPVGTIVKSSQGYWKEKVAEPNKWEFCQRLTLKRAGIEIPKGCLVMFLDGDINNYADIDNLEIVTKAESMALTQMGVRKGTSRELTKTALNVIRLKNKVNSLKEQKEE